MKFYLTISLLMCVLHISHGRDFAYFGLLGPDHWAEQYNTCSGKHQSPININVLDVVEERFDPLVMQRFNESPSHAEILNNGHTVVLRYEYEHAMPTISGGPLKHKGTYQFAQLHFHWGENNTIGSEDRINNMSYPAELHMVFYNVKYLSFQEAIAQDNSITVLAFFFEIQPEDNDNYVEFSKLLDYVREPDMHVDFVEPPSLSQLITNDTINYYTYIGSLTTPPCSEDVTWIDFATPIRISTEQLERFRRLNSRDGQPLRHNFRPIQPLNNRIVYKSLNEISNSEDQEHVDDHVDDHHDHDDDGEELQQQQKREQPNTLLSRVDEEHVAMSNGNHAASRNLNSIVLMAIGMIYYIRSLTLLT